MSDDSVRCEQEQAFQEFVQQCREGVLPCPSELARLFSSFPADYWASLAVVHLAESWNRGQPVCASDYVALFANAKLPIELLEQEFKSSYEHPHLRRLMDVAEFAQQYGGSSEITARLAGQTFAGGRYVRIRFCGQGGLGSVWMAFDRHLGRHVAIKHVKPYSNDPVKLHRKLKNEARITARLNHPGIVAVHEFHEENADPFYVMEYINGESLRDRIARFHAASFDRRSFAQLIRDFQSVCEAVGNSHQQQIRHGDLKPENVLVADFSRVIVVDWGLAQEHRIERLGEVELDETARGDLTQSGTVTHAAPELFVGEAGLHTDIFGLGTILYEILTGRPPFQLTEKETVDHLLARASESQFSRPSDVVANVPGALEAICLKAMSQNPSDRFTSPVDIIREVNNWFIDEPVSIHRELPHQKLARIVRRHSTVALVVSTSVVLAFLILTAWYFHSQKAAIATALLEKDRALIAEDRATLAEEKRKAAVKNLEFQAVQRILLSDRSAGWRKDAEKKLLSIADIEADKSVRDTYVNALIGFDAEKRYAFQGPGTFVSTDENARCLIVAGDEKVATRIVDMQTGEIYETTQFSSGAVAFSLSGQPIQLVINEDNSYSVVDLLSNEEVQRLSSEYERPAANSETPTFTSTAFSTDGSLLAISPVPAKSGYQTGVWSATSGALLTLVPALSQGSALAFSRDNRHLAVGSRDGTVLVWSIIDSRAVSRLKSGAVAIQCLEFSNHGTTHRLGPELLAAGDAGGTVTVWDISREIPISFCRGSRYHVYAVSFSPDDSYLVSGGRADLRVWETATGAQVLQIPAANTINDVAIAADGKTIVCTAMAAHGEPGGIQIFDLENGRGIVTLNGLSSSASKTVFSPDGSLVAAFSHNWEAAVWDRTSRILRYRLELPEGFFVDNGDIVISDDNSFLAFSSGEFATLWNLETGKREWMKKLPPGLGDQLAFTPAGALLLFRFETRSGEVGPFTEFTYTEHPRICRIRDLLRDDYLSPIAEIPDFDRHVFTTGKASDGSFFLAEGIYSRDGGGRLLRVFAGGSGRPIWTIPTKNEHLSARVAVDPANRWGVVYNLLGDQSASLVDFEQQSIGANMMQLCRTIGGDGRYGARRGGKSCSIINIATDRVLFQVGYGIPRNDTDGAFSPDGCLYAFGFADGRVVICDIDDVTELLNDAGLLVP